MKIYTSYFYQVRFFKPNMIPLSTAQFDPKWYNQNRGQGYVFKDKNGVYNGLRAEPFAPGQSCSNDCRGPQNCPTKDFNSCSFLQKYYAQLCQLDFNDIMNRIERIANHIQNLEQFTDEPIVVLLVHEASDNPCSERKAIQKWFADNGVIVEEWKHTIEIKNTPFVF